MSKTKIDDDLREAVKQAHWDRFRRIRCAGCGRVVVPGGFEIDHIKPEALGGLTALENLQILCVRKNGKKKVGCHMDKSRREAGERARLARGPRPLAIPLFGMIVGPVGLIWAYLDLFKGPEAARAFLLWCVMLAGASIALFILGNVVTERNRARPQENNPFSVKTPEASAPQSSSGTAPEQSRITSAAREVMGRRGDVRTVMDGAGQFRIHYPGTGFDDSKEGDGRTKLVEKINAKIEGRWKPRWDTERDIVTFTRRPDLPRRVPHPGFDKNRPWNILPIAPGMFFDLLITSHLLIIGKVNSGKTSLLRAIILAASDSARRGADAVKVWLFDPKQIEFLGFRGWTGVERIVSDAEELWDAAIELEDEMKRRYGLLKDDNVPLSSHPRLIVVIDEFEHMVTQFYRLWQESSDPKYKKKTGERMPRGLTAIRTVIAVARKCGIHVVASTQDPAANNFGGTGARQNMEGRAAVGRVDGIRARQTFDDASVGRDLPEGIKGRATMQVLEGEPEEIQTYWVPDPADADGTNTAEDWDHLKRLGMAA